MFLPDVNRAGLVYLEATRVSKVAFRLSKYPSNWLFIGHSRAASRRFINLSCSYLPVTRAPHAYHHFVNYIRSWLPVALDSTSLFVSVTLCCCCRRPSCRQGRSEAQINQLPNIHFKSNTCLMLCFTKTSIQSKSLFNYKVRRRTLQFFPHIWNFQVIYEGFRQL